ncbi:hypothetical protein TNCV_4409461 [Trichonephila clavipes]|nr:hypothetical protein TNCV_4409461 [Trichonephila clavipes]
MLRRLVGTTAPDIMIVQFRNEKVSNHDSIPITIDCNVLWPSSFLKKCALHRQTKFAYENREQRQSRFGPIRRIYALLDDRFDELSNQTENKINGQLLNVAIPDLKFGPYLRSGCQYMKLGKEVTWVPEEAGRNFDKGPVTGTYTNLDEQRPPVDGTGVASYSLGMGQEPPGYNVFLLTRFQKITFIDRTL